MTIRLFSLIALSALVLAFPFKSSAQTDAEMFAKLKAAGGQSQIQEIVTLSLARGDISCVQTRDGLTTQVQSTKCIETPNQDYQDGKMNR